MEPIDPINLECPYCHSGPGTLCMTNSKQVKIYFHQGRIDLATPAPAEEPIAEVETVDAVVTDEEVAFWFPDSSVHEAVEDVACGEHPDPEWPCPTCDICDESECSTPDLKWNGETGNHHVCETFTAPAKPSAWARFKAWMSK